MSSKPKVKSFDNSKHLSMIEDLDKNMSEKEFERLSEVVVPEILINHEGFSEVIKGPNFSGTPFDFFGFKDDTPYIIEFKGSLSKFNTPGETQKRRIQEILERIHILYIALLQVNLIDSRYRILYDDEMNHLFEGKRISLEPIIDWINGKL